VWLEIRGVEGGKTKRSLAKEIHNRRMVRDLQTKNKCVLGEGNGPSRRLETRGAYVINRFDDTRDAPIIGEKSKENQTGGDIQRDPNGAALWETEGNRVFFFTGKEKGMGARALFGAADNVRGGGSVLGRSTWVCEGVE